MEYVALLRFRSSISSTTGCCACPPGGLAVSERGKRDRRVLPMSDDVQVVSIFSTDDIAAIWEFEAEWNDVFDIDVSPAVSAETVCGSAPRSLAD